MAEYIEREKLLRDINHYHLSDGKFQHWVEVQPAADVAPVVHGRWLQKKHKIFGNAYDYVCSECGCDYALAEYNYCPNCGAKMDGVDDG